MQTKQDLNTCPCGGMIAGSSYAACCRPFIEGLQPAPSAEHLMRSRYTAYVMADVAYVRATWHPSTRPTDLVLESPGAPHAIRWLGLTVHSHTQLTDTQAQVMFTAKYREAGRAHRIKEHSRFVLESGQWFYVDGDVDFNQP
ncbi:hypothetical protein EKL30_08970 [Candidimonas sp. SYP-B2681]|uniref:YchJ family protein n=1 Tax=Candidimonas sp. SYP-B2681 TaxID=2497686 RepID=UPI000F86E55F|nr:YchJ family metal-binding protein [Candidimonas sp. SYP-B2681]RTZ44680.1 hypothetical protein EKL30_08970 [Candidimonas sp. SYP-B2681]